MKGKNSRKENRRFEKDGRTGKTSGGRAALVMTLLAMVVFGLLLSGRSNSIANAAEGTEDVEYKYYTTITVEKGDTLWDLAVENYSEKYYDSVSEYVEEVKAINGLKDDSIHEGAKLVIVYFSPEYK